MAPNSRKRTLVPLRHRAASEPALSDEALALACSSADPAAIAELFDRFRVAIANYLLRLLGDAHDVEDCLQATFLEVARGRARFSGYSSASTWLLGIATNVARHHRRSSGRRARLQAAFECVTDGASLVFPDAAANAEQELARINRILDGLSAERREAFVLCEIEGLSAREASVVLGVSETAIWKRVSDARRVLRERLQGPA